jgi:hypothetical protein
MRSRQLKSSASISAGRFFATISFDNTSPFAATPSLQPKSPTLWYGVGGERGRHHTTASH